MGRSYGAWRAPRVRCVAPAGAGCFRPVVLGLTPQAFRCAAPTELLGSGGSVCCSCRGWLFSAGGPGACALGFSMGRSYGAFGAWGFGVLLLPGLSGLGGYVSGRSAGCSWGASKLSVEVLCRPCRGSLRFDQLPGAHAPGFSMCCSYGAFGPWGFDVLLPRSFWGLGVRCVAPAGLPAPWGYAPGCSMRRSRGASGRRWTLRVSVWRSATGGRGVVCQAHWADNIEDHGILPRRGVATIGSSDGDARPRHPPTPPDIRFFVSGG